MSNGINELEKLLEILSNNIVYNFDEFDRNLSLEEKRKILDELDKLLLKYETANKKIQEEFYISSQYIKSKYRSLVKEFNRRFINFSNEIIQKKNLYKTLTMSNSFIAPSISIDLGEGNKHSLDYSKIKTVLNDAKYTSNIIDKYIFELENEIKDKPLIDQNDPAYQSYINFKTKKKEMKTKNKQNFLKWILLILIIVLIIVIYYFK
jgi:hypothetical protein